MKHNMRLPTPRWTSYDAKSRREKKRLSLLNLIGPAILILCLAETLPAEENAGDTDPSRIVYLSFREEYYNLDGGVWNNQVIYRSDKAIFKKNRLTLPKGLLLRWDLPFVTTHRGSETTSGLGDLYFQGVLVRTVGRGNVAVGPALVLPTATNDLVGTGQWQFAPLVVPFWYFSNGRGLFLVKAQDFVSFAGDEERPDLHFFLTTVDLLWRLDAKFWIVAETEAQTNWKNNRTSFKSGLQFGRVLNRQFAMWVKPEIPWGSNSQGDWNIKFTLLWIK